MKNLIKKIDTHLLEKYPVIWNTKLLWMILVGLVCHILFFVFGLMYFTNPESLQERNVKYDFFDDGVVFFNVILSILILLIWVIYMFKNNTFKNFYPTKGRHLFYHFVQYIFIVFFNICFFYSFFLGSQTYISSKYDDELVSEQIDTINNAAIFFSHNVKKYMLNNKSYPAPFDTLYCESNRALVKDSLPKIEFLTETYQFYTTKSDTTSIDNYNRFSDENGMRIDSQVLDSIRVNYYKDKVVDVSNEILTNKPSFYNYNDRFYDESTEYNNYRYYDYTDIEYTKPNWRNSSKNNKITYNFIKDLNKEQLNQLFNNAIEIAKTYKIKHNLDAKTWADLVYHPPTFEIKGIIHSSEPSYYRYDLSKELTPIERYEYEMDTSYYFESRELFNVFDNINDIKTHNVFEISIHLYLWISCAIGAFIFLFRITNLKTLLLSIITAIVLLLFMALINIAYSGPNSDFFAMYSFIVLGLVILSIPLLFIKDVKKIISGIFMNLTIYGFPSFLLLILITINEHQRDNCKYFDTPCHTILDIFDENWSFVILIITLIFIFFYTKIIKRWRALPEA